MVSNPYYLARFGNTVINGAPGITSGLQGGVTASMPAGSFAGAIATSKIADGAPFLTLASFVQRLTHSLALCAPWQSSAASSRSSSPA